MHGHFAGSARGTENDQGKDYILIYEDVEICVELKTLYCAHDFQFNSADIPPGLF